MEDDRIETVGESYGASAGRPRGWFTRLARRYIQRHFEKRQGGVECKDDALASKRAVRAIRWACAKSAISGAVAGSASTGATMVAAQTEGLLAFVTAPVVALAIGGEMLYRSKLQIDLTCQLADIFGLEVDPKNDTDTWRLFALAFGTSDHEDDDSEDPGQELVKEVTHLEGEDVGEKIGHLVLGESVMRNIIPFVGVVSSAVTNVLLTRKLGHTVRRYMRYRRAFRDAFDHACADLVPHMDLLIEGMWFIFTADGKLEPEEAACLAHMLHKLDPVHRHAVVQRFGDDDDDWTRRLGEELPEEHKTAFLHALEVAAAVDKEVSTPERKLLRRATRALGREFDMDRLEKMMREFERAGVLSKDTHLAAAEGG